MAWSSMPSPALSVRAVKPCSWFEIQLVRATPAFENAVLTWWAEYLPTPKKSAISSANCTVPGLERGLCALPPGLKASLRSTRLLPGLLFPGHGVRGCDGTGLHQLAQLFPKVLDSVAPVNRLREDHGAFLDHGSGLKGDGSGPVLQERHASIQRLRVLCRELQVEVRPVGSGSTVYVRVESRPLPADELAKLLPLEMPRAAKRHVLDEMSKAALGLCFGERAHSYHEAQLDDPALALTALGKVRDTVVQDLDVHGRVRRQEVRLARSAAIPRERRGFTSKLERAEAAQEDRHPGRSGGEREWMGQPHGSNVAAPQRDA